MFGSLAYKVPFITRSKGVELTDLLGNFLLSSASYIAYQWNAVYQDDLGAVTNLTLAKSKIVIQREGWYLATAQIFYVGNTTGARGLKIALNAITNLAFQEVGANNATSQCYTTVSALVYCVPQDYLEVYVYQDIGSTMQPVNLYFNVVQMN